MPVTPMTEREALDVHLHLVHMGGLGRDYNKITPKTVWHYTNMSGLNGILQNSCLWASDYRYMNDASELEFGLQILEICIAHHETTSTIDRPLRSDILIEIALMKKNIMGLHVMTTSFCLRGNVLSQWRAYARQDGLAIGFRREHIEAQARAHGFLSDMVHYYFSDNQQYLTPDEKFGPWLGRRILTLKERIANHQVAVRLFDEAQGRNDDTVPFASVHQIKNIVRSWCAETAAFIKHPLFEEEQEWRCVKVINDQSSIFRQEIDHRQSGTKIIPCINLPISEPDSADKGISLLVLGPNADSRSTNHSVKFLADKYNLNDLAIASPFNPLRV
ncbi:DUF2971 domain-containing protein [Methylobacterium sp. NEAU 140]|uniref:DUF2971 domain-containing protein n=1 Tax=Methylobacterium sp. NEAU 140 TaxID=3064945 RepID=UPI002735ED2A|nr:DUF2971 domain-containing protein [Methylobacterium sp. NEAU 140]MDP4022061.1 DUF2971 domain-containing protein [Methylobacterium sp. NEAU 140]